MAYWNVQKPYNQDKVAVGSIYFNAVRAVSIDTNNIGLNSEGQKVVPSGLFLAEVDGKVRFLPRDYAKNAIATTDTQIEVSMPEIFLAGDDLYHLESEGLVTVGAGAAGDKVTIRFVDSANGLNIGYTHTQVGGTLAELTAELITVLNGSANPLSEYARFESDTDGEIKVFNTGARYTIEASAEGGASATVTNQLDTATKLIGRIASVDFANSTITLEAASAVEVSAGARIGTNVDQVYGLYNHSKDFTQMLYCDLKAIERCDRVYKSGLPYFDTQLALQFPNMNFV
jgi:hypothetical protein